MFVKEEEGWARGILNGKEGVFPVNFTTVVNDVIPTSPVEAPVPKPEHAISEQRSGSKKVGLFANKKGLQVIPRL